jgi:hypothetical protein
MTNREVFTKIFNNPTFKNHFCSCSCEAGLPCVYCDWWDEKYADSEEKKPPFKIFISQPMKDRTDEEIMQERNKIMIKMTEVITRSGGQPVEFIDSFFCEPGKNSTDSLGKSISLMGEADLVVFAPGWEDARGCRIEHEVAKEYGIQISYFV